LGNGVFSKISQVTCQDQRSLETLLQLVYSARGRELDLCRLFKKRTQEQVRNSLEVS
jgi:hypothetical protein